MMVPRASVCFSAVFVGGAVAAVLFAVWLNRPRDQTMPGGGTTPPPVSVKVTGGNEASQPPPRAAPKGGPSRRDGIWDRKASAATRNAAANERLDRRDPALAGELMAMLNDTGEDPQWRNYCAQFLAVCYERAPDPAIWRALREATAYGVPEVSSCALWSLAQLKAACPATVAPGESAWLDSEVLRASAERQNTLIQATGLRCAGLLGLRGALPELRRVAGAPGDIFVRTAAVEALGRLHDADSKGLLAALAQGNSPRLARAAAAALRHLAAGAPDAAGATPATAAHELPRERAAGKDQAAGF